MKKNIKLTDFINESTTFISDSGRELVFKNTTTGKEIRVGRYGVWTDKDRRKPEVIETSNNLELLLKKYNLTKDHIVKL